MEFAKDTKITILINDSEQFTYPITENAKLQSLTFSESRVNSTEGQKLNILDYSQKIGHDNKSKTIFRITHPNNTQEDTIISKTTNNVYYAKIPNMNITLTGDSDSQKYNLAISLLNCTEADMPADSSSYAMKVNGYSFQLKSYSQSAYSDLVSKSRTIKYSFGCSDIDYTVSECYTVMQHIQNSLKNSQQEQEFTISYQNTYAKLIQDKINTDGCNATFPEFIFTLDKNAIISLVVVVVAIILIIALLIYCCVDYRSSALKEVPIQQGRNSGFGQANEQLSFHQAKHNKNKSNTYGFGFKDDLSRYKEKRELSKSRKNKSKAVNPQQNSNQQYAQPRQRVQQQKVVYDNQQSQPQNYQQAYQQPYQQDYQQGYPLQAQMSGPFSNEQQTEVSVVPAVPNRDQEQIIQDY